MFVHHLTQDVTYSTGNTRREVLHAYTSSVNQTGSSVPESRLFTIYTFLYKNKQNTAVKLDIPHAGSKNINVIHNKNESTVPTHKCKQWGSFLFLQNLSLQTNTAGLLFYLKEVFWSRVEGVQRGPLLDRKGKVIQYKGVKDRKWAGTNNGKPGARNLEAESTRSRAESMRGCVKLRSIPSVWPMGRFSVAVVDKVTLALNHLDHLKKHTKQNCCVNVSLTKHLSCMPVLPVLLSVQTMLLLGAASYDTTAVWTSPSPNTSHACLSCQFCCQCKPCYC